MADHKNWAFSLKRIIANDKSLILFSLFLAVIIWIITMLSMGTEDVREIVVTVPTDNITSEYAEQNHLKYYTLKDSVDVTVSISGEAYIIGQADAEDIDISFDTQSITGTGKQSLKLIAEVASDSRLDFNIDELSINYVEVYIDNELEKTFDVSWSMDGVSAADGYFLDEKPTLSDTKVKVSGPRSCVESINGVSLDFDSDDVKNLSSTHTSDYAIHYDGNIADEQYLTAYSVTEKNKVLTSINAMIPVYHEVTLPVTVTLDGLPNKVDAEQFSIQCNPKEMTVGVLADSNVNEISVASIPVSDIYESSASGAIVYQNEFACNKNTIKTVVLKKDIDYPDKISVTIRLPETYEVTAIPVSVNDITFQNTENAPSGFDADALTEANKDFLTVWVVAPTKSVSGAAKPIDPLTIDDLTMVCDFSTEATNGKVPVVITVNGNNAWVAGEYNILL